MAVSSFRDSASLNGSEGDVELLLSPLKVYYLRMDTRAHRSELRLMGEREGGRRGVQSSMVTALMHLISECFLFASLLNHCLVVLNLQRRY